MSSDGICVHTKRAKSRGTNYKPDKLKYEHPFSLVLNGLGANK